MHRDESPGSSRAPRSEWVAALAAMVGLAVLPSANADSSSSVRTEPGQFIAIAVEAEAAIEADERWTFTAANTPQSAPDPDGNHSDGAAGGVYLELLPDNRVTREDENFPPGTPGYGWSNGGDGPEMTYAIDFPEAGRWYVHARAFHTGSEDNGIHVGLNGEWPASGKQMQWCHKDEWWWSSQQRGTVDRHCGLGERTIWLDVATAGPNEVVFGAREDGFELDRFMLIKDLSAGTRECLPTGVDDIDCGDGVIEAIDGFVDVGVELEFGSVADEPAHRRAMVATVANNDGRDAASLVSLDVPVGNDWTVVEADERCAVQVDSLICALGDLAAGDSTLVTFTLEASRSGSVPIAAAVSSNESDDDMLNDATDAEVEIAAIAAIDASLGIGTDPVVAGESFEVDIVLSNTGVAAADDIAVALSVPSTIEVVSVPGDCVHTRTIACSVASIEAGQSVEFTITLAGTEPSDASVLRLDVSAEGHEPMADVLELQIMAEQTTVETGPGSDGTDDRDESGQSDAAAFGAGLLAWLACIAFGRSRRRQWVGTSE